MLEAALVLVALLLVGVVLLLGTIPLASLATLIGMATLGLGLLIGVPSGFWYHVVLYRYVGPRVPLARTWWLSPSNLHRHLTDDEQRHIALWYRIGGVGFVLCLAGGLAAIGGLLLQR